MDTHVKEGQLYVQTQKFGKKWKKNWFVLYPASQNGIARLEYFDCGGSSTEKPNTKKLDKKIIRLSECISIIPALTETCPKDNMAAFHVETNDKTYVFAAERHVTSEWMEKMCELAFQGGSGCFTSMDLNGQQELQMSENMIYFSREEVNEFWVSVQRTEASERCGLMGNYWLKANGDRLILKDPKTKRKLLVWPYKLLRRYGRDRVMFSFEAGRRCESGPGNFTFETKQGNEIFQIVEGAIREQKAQADENNQSCSSLDGDCPVLQQIRATIAEGIAREADGDSGGSKPGSADGVITRRDGEGKNLKGRSLPEPPVPVSGTLSRGPKSGNLLEDQVNLYAEPADSVRLPAVLGECFYADPVDSIKPAPPSNSGGKPEPFYADIYDRVSHDVGQRVAALGLEPRGRRPAEGAQAEHIYDEPEGRAAGQPPNSMYDEARLENQSWRSRGPEEQQGHDLSYNPSKDDYNGPPVVRTVPPPAASKPKGPKPVTAPKPTKVTFPRKDSPSLLHGKLGANLNNNNSRSNGFSGRELRNGGSGERKMEKHAGDYRKVSKLQPHVSVWQTSMRPPDIIYDNLGDI